jgi:hypothetical protein
MPLRLRGCVFTEPPPRRGLHIPVVPLLHECITYKRLFLWLDRSRIDQIIHIIIIIIIIIIIRRFSC